MECETILSLEDDPITGRRNLWKGSSCSEFNFAAVHIGTQVVSVPSTDPRQGDRTGIEPHALDQGSGPAIDQETLAIRRSP